MPPTGEAYNIDWIFGTGSNVHACNHRDWFDTLTPFDSVLRNGAKVEGVGTVKLTCKANSSQTPDATINTVVLYDVVYVPTYVVNIVGAPINKQYGVVLGYKGESYLWEKNVKTPYALIEENVLPKMWLEGQAPHTTVLSPHGIYMMNATWAPEEKMRWAEFKDKNKIED